MGDGMDVKRGMESAPCAFFNFNFAWPGTRQAASSVVRPFAEMIRPVFLGRP